MKIILFFILASVCLGQELDLRKPLSQEQYQTFCGLMAKEVSERPKDAKAEAKQMIITMGGLDSSSKDLTDALDKSAVYDVNVLLLIVANSSHIRLSESDIQNFKKKSFLTAQSLKDKPDQAAFIEMLSSSLVLMNSNIKQ